MAMTVADSLVRARTATKAGTPYARSRAERDVSRLMDEAAEEIETLERRLEDGYRRIEEGIADGADVRAWEDFWMGLLRDYETLCDAADRNSGRWDLPYFTLET